MDELADVSWGDTATTKASYTKDGFLAFSASGPDGYLPYYDYERDGVVVSAIGANSGRVFFARERWSCIKNTIRFWGRDGVCDTRFLYYATSDPGVWPKRGSAQPFISQGDARALKLSVPTDVSEQRRIASILGALDDKIDGNRRLARRLEEITATAFCARFVDFVGVEEFEESSVGRIPSGWRVGALTDLARFVNGKAFTQHKNNRGRPILRIKELNDDIGNNTPYSDIDAADEHVAHDRDILFAWSGSLDVYRWSGPESLINQHIFKVIPEGYPPWFVYQWTRQHMADFRAIARDKATTMGHIQRRHLSEAAVSIPDVAAISAARDALDPIDDQQGTLIGEIGTLRKLQEVLLPKLISGEIRVPDTHDPEEVIGPVAEELAAATP